MDITSEFIVAIVAGIIVAAIQYYFFESKSKKNEFVPPSVVHTTTRVVETHQTNILCANCNSLNRSDINYCTKCGKPLYEPCPFCFKSKPMIDKRCGNCGKDPQEIRTVKYFIMQLRNKAYLLGIAYLSVVIRVISLAEEPSWIDFLSVLIVILGIYCLGWEANYEFKWLYNSRVWHLRENWLPETTKDTERSLWIFAGITFSIVLPFFVLIAKIFRWIL